MSLYIHRNRETQPKHKSDAYRTMYIRIKKLNIQNRNPIFTCFRSKIITFNLKSYEYDVGVFLFVTQLNPGSDISM